jgi:hypothetical protein
MGGWSVIVLNESSLINMRRFLVFFLTMILLTSSAAAQKTEKEERKEYLYGQVFDSFTRNFLDSAMVTVMTTDSAVIARDTAYTRRSGTQVWGRGYFIYVPAHPAQFIIKAEAPGYATACTDYELKRIGRRTGFHVPGIYLKKTARDVAMETEMKEFVVKASKVQLVWRGDTMVYDATAFNLPEGSMLDDLIRQLPGVQLKENGEITVNGEKIDYLTLNGKDFFKGNNKMMLDNLPYFTVKNVQVFHKRTRKSEYLGYDVERKDYVMDVRLKREYAKGYIANVECAVGTHERWLARAFGLRYTDNARVTLMGNANNVNEDRRPGSDGDWTPTNQPLGLKTTEMLNADYHYERQGKWTEEASVGVTWNKTENESRTTSTTYVPTGDVHTRSQNASLNKSFAANIANSFYLSDPLFMQMSTTFDTSPTRSWTNGSSETLTSDSLTNSTLTDGYTDGRSWSLGHSMMLLKGLPWGDNVQLMLGGGYNESRSDGYQHNNFDYYRPSGKAEGTAAQGPSSDHRNEYRPDRSRSHEWQAGLTYNFALGKGWNLEAGYSHSQEFSSGKNPLYRLDRDSTFSSLAPSLGELPLLTAALQDSLNSQWTSHWTRNDVGSLQLGYSMYKDGERYVNLFVYLPLTYKYERERYTRYPIDTTVVQKNVTLNSSLYFTYNDLRHHNSWGCNYSQSTLTPSITDLIGYCDASNPLSVRLGNPDLHSSHRHVVRVHYGHSVPRLEQNFSISTAYDVTIGQIMQTYNYDSQTGAYTYKPKNVNGNWWWDGSVNFTTALDSTKHWRLTNEVRVFRHNVAYAANGVETTTRRLNVRERFGLRYKLNERFDVEPTANVEWERAWSPLETYKTTNIWDIYYGVNLHWRLPWELHLSTDLREYHRRGFEDPSLNTNHLIWNAELSRSFLKGQLTAKLVGYDMLGQISHTSWTVGSEGISSTWQRGIPSYFMAHLAWKFTRKPKKE